MFFYSKLYSTFEVSNNQKTNKTMRNLKNKVEVKLIKGGNNLNDVKEMMDLHFEYAASKYSTVKTIAECIRTIY